jgi:Glyoxalase-like domain
MPARISHIDHPVFAVKDLEGAHKQFQRLGFVVPPIGRHSEWGTGNICIMFASDYLEIRGIVDPSRYLAGLEEFFEQGEGLIGVAFGMESAQASYDAAREAGIKVTEPRNLQRLLKLEDKTLDLRFCNVMLEPEDYPGFTHANLCQHITADRLRQPGWLDHPNTAVSTSEIVGVVADLDTAQRAYERLLGKSAVARNKNDVRLSFPKGATVELILPDQAAARGIAQPARGKDYMASIAIAVRNLDALRAVLAKNGIAAHDKDKSVVVDTRDAGGAHLAFVEA